MDSTGCGGCLGDFVVAMLDSEMVVNDGKWLWIRRLMEKPVDPHILASFIAAMERMLEFYSN